MSLRRRSWATCSNSKSPELSLKPGEVVYTLHYLGEGYDLFWYHGKTYHDQISIAEDAWGNVPFHETLKVESRPKTEWWVKIKDHAGTLAGATKLRCLRTVESMRVRANNALERTVKQRGPRLAAARSSWPAAQLGR